MSPWEIFVFGVFVGVLIGGISSILIADYNVKNQNEILPVTKKKYPMPPVTPPPPSINNDTITAIEDFLNEYKKRYEK
jgi:hypothetical protein